jgi:hypothetical protein
MIMMITLERDYLMAQAMNGHRAGRMKELESDGETSEPEEETESLQYYDVRMITSSLLKILPQMSLSQDMLLSIVVSALIEVPFALPTRLSKSTLVL